MLGAAVLIFVSDVAITFLQMRERTLWLTGRGWKSAIVDGLTACVIGASIILIAEYRWPMLVPSVLGVLVGRYLDWRI